MECGVWSLVGDDDDIGSFLPVRQFSWASATFLMLIGLARLVSYNNMVNLTFADFHFGKMSDCIGFPFCFVILVKIDDYLTPRFVFDVLHSGASLPDFYMLLIGSSTCFYITQVTIWLQWEHIFYSNVTFEVGTIIMSHVFIRRCRII